MKLSTLKTMASNAAKLTADGAKAYVDHKKDIHALNKLTNKKLLRAGATKDQVRQVRDEALDDKVKAGLAVGGVLLALFID